MFGTYFYHKTIKRVITVFGTLFNNISILKTDSAGNVFNQVKIPLAYGPRNSTLRRIFERTTTEDDKIAIKVPRMSFENTSLTFNPEQRLGNIQRITHKVLQTGEDVTSRRLKRTYMYAPYKMNISLTIYSNTQDDMLQITEQILPYFNPDFTVTVKSLGEMDSTYDLPFTLMGVQPTIEYEGDPLSRFILTTTLDFETEPRFFGPITEQGIIKKAIATFTDYHNRDKDIERVTVEAVPEGSPVSGYQILETFEIL